MTLRDRIVLVFDEHYTKNGHVVHAAAQHLIGQMQGIAEYRLFCQMRYHGPRFRVRSAKIGLVDRPSLFARLAARVRSRLERMRLADSPDRSVTNIEARDEPLTRYLFRADRIHAVVVFTLDLRYALRIARLAHIFSGPSTPHLVVVTPGSDIDPETARDLKWLRVRILRDGQVVDGRPHQHQQVVPRFRYLAAVVGRQKLQPRAATVPTPFDDPLPLSFLDSASYPYKLSDAGTEVYWPNLIGQDQPLPARIRDIVLFIRPDWVNCGSGTTFHSLATYFRKHDALLIDIGVWPYPVPFTSQEATRRIQDQQRNIRSAIYYSVRRTGSLLHVARQLPKALLFPPLSIVNQVLFQNTLATKPRLLTQIVQHARLTHIYLNHYFTYLFAAQFIAGRKFFMDTHDIQAINFVHTAARNVISGRSDEFEALLASEMRIVGLAERVCFVSTAEMMLAAKLLPHRKLDYIIPLPEVVARPSKPTIGPPRLLIVASNNVANVQGVTWFLNQVWPRILEGCAERAPGAGKALSPQLDICGEVQALFENQHLPGVRFRGFVAQIELFYQQCDIVVLPVTMGGGVAIKTVEALLHERAVVATRHALRGLPEAVVDTVGYANEPEYFADRVVTLLRSASARDDAVERSRRAVGLLEDQHFYERLAHAMAAVRLPQSERLPGTESEQLLKTHQTLANAP